MRENQHPQKSTLLQVYQSLQGRMDFSFEQKNSANNEHKGFEGEMEFAGLIDTYLNTSHIALYSLLLEYRGALFQPDVLLLFQNEIVLIDVKYFEGECEFQNDQLYSHTYQKEYNNNPLHQLQRCENSLRGLLPKLGSHLPITSHIVFIHPEFTLFHAEQNPTIVLPTQVNSFIRKINRIPGQVNKHHERLSEQLVKRHISPPPHTKYPPYSYEQIQKGVLCRKCRLPMVIKNRLLQCSHCLRKESIDSGILRNTIEFHILFPDRKMTTSIIHDWCNLDITKKSINRILTYYLNRNSNNKGAHYTFK
jgi:hypothetical protein